MPQTRDEITEHLTSKTCFSTYNRRLMVAGDNPC